MLVFPAGGIWWCFVVVELKTDVCYSNCTIIRSDHSTATSFNLLKCVIMSLVGGICTQEVISSSSKPSGLTTEPRASCSPTRELHRVPLQTMVIILPSSVSHSAGASGQGLRVLPLEPGGLGLIPTLPHTSCVTALTCLSSLVCKVGVIACMHPVGSCED